MSLWNAHLKTVLSDMKSVSESVLKFLDGVNTVRQMMRRWCQRLAIAVCSPHDLRRTFGTRCAEAEIYPKHLQSIMGHKNIEITMRFYVHLSQQSLLDALQGVTL